jgi:phage-related protein
MNDTQLQIIISLVNDAAGQLTEVGEQLSTLATQAADASELISSSLTTAEQTATEAAANVASTWSEEIEAIPGVTQAAFDTISEQWLGISETAESAATAASESWQNSLNDLQGMMAEATVAAEDDFAAVGEAASSAASNAGGSFGYFHNLILGMLAERSGGVLTGMVQDVISAAAGNPEQIAQLTDQIDQQRASIASNEVALTKWNGTTAAVSAAHQKAAADIQAEQTKIADLTRQLEPLEAAQKASGTAATQYLAAVQQLTIDWQQFLATAGAPLLQALAQQLMYIDNIVQALTAYAKEHPEVTKAILTFMGVLGPLLTGLGVLTVAWAMLDLVLSATVGPFVLIGVAIAVAAAAVIAFWPQIQQLFDYLNEKYGIVNTLRAAWEQLSTEFTSHLIPDLERLWTDLQPLLPYLEKFAVFLGGTMITVSLTFADAVLQVADAFAQLLDHAIQVADFLTTHLEPILNTIQSLFSKFGLGSIGGAISGAASSANSSILTSLLSAIPGFATGGIVNGPTLAMVGENGPEAIIPLSAFNGGGSLGGGGSGGFGGGINIYIQGGSYLDQGGAQQIADALASSIGRQLKLKNFF